MSCGLKISSLRSHENFVIVNEKTFNYFLFNPRRFTVTTPFCMRNKELVKGDDDLFKAGCNWS